VHFGPEEKLSVREFRRRKVPIWLYSLGWVAVTLCLWNSGLALGWKVAIQLPLALVIPDTETLFESYRTYERRFNQRRDLS
jgi:hypothetical protein